MSKRLRNLLDMSNLDPGDRSQNGYVEKQNCKPDKTISRYNGQKAERICNHNTKVFVTTTQKYL
jgi:hypothetical protein